MRFGANWPTWCLLNNSASSVMHGEREKLAREFDTVCAAMPRDFLLSELHPISNQYFVLSGAHFETAYPLQRA